MYILMVPSFSLKYDWAYYCGCHRPLYHLLVFFQVEAKAAEGQLLDPVHSILLTYYFIIDTAHIHFLLSNF